MEDHQSFIKFDGVEDNSYLLKASNIVSVTPGTSDVLEPRVEDQPVSTVSMSSGVCFSVKGDPEDIVEKVEEKIIGQNDPLG